MPERHVTANDILVLQLANQSGPFLYNAKSEYTTQVLYTYVLDLHSMDRCCNLPHILHVDRYMYVRIERFLWPKL